MSDTNFNSEKKIPEFGEVDFIVVSAVPDYDMKHNDIFADDSMKSFPRMLYCSKCGRKVVMSNGAFGLYQASEKKPPILCGRCLMDAIKNDTDPLSPTK